ncbi:MAG: pyruvate, phosphate dikinase [Anaerolineales bacterium]|jgi:pyruvate,orthophosphate dikinase|nr:Pyruvate, phosphate dikinase [Anaerolineales bacterium]MCZ7550442.1 pyruvate, phosphate dikinase [Anaerolineales bacterium]MDX9936993.1 pyruvate, phosphate dikinase [Anaerolineales bacterium]GER79644.1 pyruvate, phosphate dikinase [Candidatus Denitrolinea symbiosum]HPP62628.1 pyruvate, phosphate dikinase [Anaerolineales bacterium]
MKKWVYLFNEVNEVEKKAGSSWDSVKSLLGGKGAGLFDMTRTGVPVPPGFTVTTEACNEFRKAGKFPSGQWKQMLDAMKQVERKTGKKFGHPSNPLLVSCRSGAKFSMPGMMNTILNIGLNDAVVEGLAHLSGDPRFAWDSYRRVIEMFGTTVFGLDDEVFERPMAEYKEERGYQLDTEMTAGDWKALVGVFKEVYRKAVGEDFPQDVYKQLELATKAVFESWMGKRAIDYRRATNIPDDLGTAVNIQTMVFGNMGFDSGTGVAFTRNPSTGEKKMMGEYMLNAQGEDVVAGIRTADPIANMREHLPKAYDEFMKITGRLEKHYQDMQDVEFTIERGKLWMLQTRNGKRTAKAAVAIAVAMAKEGLITREEAVKRVTPEDVDTLLHPQFDDAARKKSEVIAKGVNASPGAAVGQIYFDADTAEKMAKEHGQEVIMVRPFTKPDDVHGMIASKGILTSEGGATSHAAVVARQFGIPAVVGASALKINVEKRQMSVNGRIFREGEWLSVDGTTGEVFLGKIPTVTPSIEEQTELLTLLGWADKIARLQVWANADYPKDARRARSYGAKGIGLCRTEHMFFEPERLPIVQDMILSESSAGRTAALDKLLPYQRKDFDGLFEAMDGLPVIIRLIDPPLHEFMPDEEKLLEEVVEMRVRGITDGLDEKEKLLAAVRSLHESNPMMGLRGVRLSIDMPEIVEMQVRAIFEAAADCALRGIVVHPEVMIPLTGTVKELEWIQPRLERIAAAVMSEKKVKFKYKFGTMVEIPRAAVTAAEIATHAQFFSFGTNDLTQMTFGYSRDDAERNFLVTYVEQGILPKNPFQTLDRDGVGMLMKWAVDEGRKTRPNLEVGICGEHGGDPDSIEWCHIIGNNYVSCSPFRVPIARLAAAHAALKHRPEPVKKAAKKKPAAKKTAKKK